jgi:hypothetical protein
MAQTSTFGNTRFYDQLLDIVVRPDRAFRRVAERPRILPPLLFVLVTTVIVYIVLSGAFSQRIEKVVEEAAIVSTSRLIGLILWLGGIFGMLQAMIALLVGGLILHAIARFLGSEASLQQTMACYLTASIPSGVRALLIANVALVLGPENTPFITMPLVESDVAPFEVMLAALDPFVLWGTILLGVGIKQVHQLAVAHAFGVSLGFLTISICVSIIPAVLNL